MCYIISIFIYLQKFEKCNSQVLFWKRGGERASVRGRSDFLFRLWKLRESNFVSGITDIILVSEERKIEELELMSRQNYERTLFEMVYIELRLEQNL